MRMNSGIILQGQQPDLVGAAHKGFTAGRQNALAGLYKEHGQGIAAGDQNALNALAQFDPKAATAIQATQQGQRNASTRMQWDREKLEMLRTKAEREAATYAQGLDAAAAAKEKEQLGEVLNGAAMYFRNGDEAGYNQWMVDQGMDVEQYPFENLPANLATLQGAKDALDALGQDKPADEYGRYVQEEIAAGREPLSRIDYKKAGHKSTVTRINPETGSIEIIEGAAAGNTLPKLTVDAAKNSGFFLRTQEANKVLNGLEDEGLNFWQQNAENIPAGLGNYARSPEFQKFDQARRDFVNAILRRESGAVISEEEFANANVQYFPVPGDSPEVIEQKRRNRETAIEGLRLGSGEGAEYVDRLNQNPAEAAQEIPEIPDFSVMSDEELDAYIAEKEGS